jgi:hypothetical protein
VRVPIRVVVSQISPPIRILLVLALAVMGVYMLFLRPKPEEIPPLDTAGTQPAQVEATPDAVDAGPATAPATKADKQGGKAQAPAAKAPAEDLKGLPKPVRRAIRANKVLVVLFSNGKSYDDKAVEKALTKVNRWDGRVFVHTAPLRRISRYGRIARGVSVEQSPTVVVADSSLKAATLVGYVDRATIDQAVVDARRYSTGLYRDSYLKAADEVCFQYSGRIAAVPFQYIGSVPQADRRFAEIDRVWPNFVADYKALKPTAKWRGFHKNMVADLEAYGVVLHRASTTITRKMKPAPFIDAYTGLAADLRPIGKRADKRLDGANLQRCGSHF